MSKRKNLNISRVKSFIGFRSNVKSCNMIVMISKKKRVWCEEDDRDEEEVRI